jgi:hypothetical protein
MTNQIKERKRVVNDEIMRPPFPSTQVRWVYKGFYPWTGSPLITNFNGFIVLRSKREKGSKEVSCSGSWVTQRSLCTLRNRPRFSPLAFPNIKTIFECQEKFFDVSFSRMIQD